MNILSTLRAEDVRDAQKMLPDVYTATEDVVQTIAAVPGVGRVCFAHLRNKYRHHKSTNWFWSTASAVTVD